MFNLGSVVLHDCVYALRVLPALYTEMYVTSFQDGNEAMDVKVEEVTDVKEEVEDPLAITCPTSDAEQEVSHVTVCPPQGRLHMYGDLPNCVCLFSLHAIEWSLTVKCALQHSIAGKLQCYIVIFAVFFY